jgi:hypothetical protein
VLGALADWTSVLPGAGGGASLVVDGVEVPRAKLAASQIAEVRIAASPYSAEFSRPGSSRIEVRTKSGSAAWHASAQSRFRDSRVDARNAFATVRPSESRQEIDADVSGPLTRGITLTAGVEVEREREQALVVARTLEGDLRYAVAAPVNDSEGRVAVQSRGVTLRYEQSRETERNRHVGGFRLAEAGTDVAASSRELQIAAHRLVRGWWSETQIRLEREASVVASLRPGIPRITVDDAFTAGGAQADESHTERSLRASHIVSRVFAKHQLRLGGQLPGLLWSTLNDRTARQGAWRFASLADYEAGRPYAFTARQGLGRLDYGIARWAAFLQDEWRARRTLSVSAGVRYEASDIMSDRTNVAPRIGIAWRAGGATVVRAGAGLFFDFLGEGTWRDTLRLNGTALREVLVRDPAFPFSEELAPALLPPTVVRLDRALAVPHIWESSVSAENRGVTVGWRQTHGRRLFRSVDRNSMRADQSVGQLREVQSAGRLAGQWLEAGWKWRAVRVQGQFGHLRSDTEGAAFLPADSLRPEGEWGYDNADRRWRVQSAMSRSLPAGIAVGAVLRAQSAAPYTLRTGRDDNRDGVANDRPAGVARNTLRGASEATLDVRLARAFRSRTEKTSVEFAIDGYNVLNRVNPSQFVGNLSSPFFGMATAARPARRFQLSVRLRR